MPTPLHARGVPHPEYLWVRCAGEMHRWRDPLTSGSSCQCGAVEWSLEFYEHYRRQLDLGDEASMNRGGV